MGSVYTVDQLLALRQKPPSAPQGADKRDQRVATYLAIWRRYQNQILKGPEPGKVYPPKLVMKYDFAKSNKDFKRQWVKTHGTSAGLSSQPRYPVWVHSVRVRFLEDFFRSLERTERLLTKLLNRISVRPSRLEVTEKPSKSSSSEKMGKAVRPFKKDRKLAVKLQHTAESSYFRVIGGPTYTYRADRPPPKGEWKKYWYFFRKKGRWRPSEHHPYGDEYLPVGSRWA